MISLIILDGFGLSDKTFGNAIASAGTPNLDKLKQKYPHTILDASGTSVGLSAGQMGNSEVGHLNIGAGRVVFQDLSRINNAIEDGTFANNIVLNESFAHAEKNGGNLHIMGLLSNGGVHSSLEHLKEILCLANQTKIKNIYLHNFMDGRDTLTNSGIGFIKEIEEYLGRAKIATICGRVYAMDRENRWDRVKETYDMLIYGKTKNYYDNPETAIKEFYDKKIFDEFLPPIIIGEPHPINHNDSVIFYNFRTDRAREITRAVIEENFNEFPQKKLNNVYFATMTEYDEKFKNVHIIFKPEKINNNLSEIISKNNLKQFHIAETTKYAHVTFFFNGGYEKPYKNEDRELIESVDVKDFSVVPDMKAFEITNRTCEIIAENKYDFVLVNLSNPDIIGHTGNFDATVRAIKTVDKCAYMLALATLMAGGECIITADHGNAELMIDDKNNIITSHTTNPVPFILCSEKRKNLVLKNRGKLSNIAPTILDLMNIEKPSDMTENSLII